MAYNVDWGTINAHSSVEVCYLINGGQDFGAQFAMGSAENPGADLVSDNHEKILSDDGRTVTYCFQLRNISDNNTRYMLEGGGLT